METQLVERGGIRIAIEGCGHGTLNAIYASIEKSCEVNNWPGVDLVIIGGDFQAVRNAKDLNCLACPPKYRHIGDFHEYYSGAQIAPYLTIFIGGNHEASNHMWELYYGGWAAPNIYYLGAANVVRFGPLRIAGLSGIWKGYNYRKPHFERLPYNRNSEKSIYHVRELDVRKLLSIRTQVDIGLSHDWPLNIERCGDYNTLFRYKPHFRDESNEGSLGSVAAKSVLDRLRPAYWFSAHMHVKFSGIYEHDKTLQHDFVHGNPNLKSLKENSKEGEIGSRLGGVKADLEAEDPSKRKHAYTIDLRITDEIDLDLNSFGQEKQPQTQHSEPSAKNNAEIGLGPDEVDDETSPEPQDNLESTGPSRNNDEIELDLSDGGEAPTSSEVPRTNINTAAQEVPESLRSQLPAAFQRPKPAQPSAQLPTEIANKITRFLALDKCLPGRQFLQIMTVEPISMPVSTDDASQKGDAPKPTLQYDKEWLAITRVFAPELHVGHPSRNVPPHRGEAAYRSAIEREERWVEENIVKTGRMTIPENFEITAPVQHPGDPEITDEQPWEYNNVQTGAFCELVGIENKFFSSDEEKAARFAQGPVDEDGGKSRGGFGRGGGYSGGRGGGSGRGRGGGGHGRGRGGGGRGRGRRGRW